MYCSNNEYESRRCGSNDSERNGRDNFCLLVVIAILAALILFTVGLLVGAVIAPLILGNLAAVLVGLSLLVVMLVLTLIYARCRCRRN